MEKFLKEQYEFSDYQIAQLQYVAKTVASELSKLLIMGFLFRRQLGIYIAAVSLMLLLRTSTGGLHCKKYFSCFLMSFSFIFLCLSVLPNIPAPKVIQLPLLFICMLLNYYIGPVTSAVHRPLDEEHINRSKKHVLLTIFFYLTISYIAPENPYCTAGFWVVILHTLQLIAAKIKKKGEKHEKQIEKSH